MNTKIKLATKRVTAVASSAMMVTAAAFGTLGAYPQNLVSNGAFDGHVVVGASAAAADTTAAASIIDDLREEFSGEAENVRITYRSSGSSGGSVDVIKSNSELNYGESLGASDVTDTLDDGDVDFLEDGSFNNGASDEDYTQEITLGHGEFNYALRDEVDGVEEIANGIFYNSGEIYLNYTLEFDTAITVTDSTADEDFVGEELDVMGNMFTVASLSTDGSGNVEELELIGGSNKVALGEGESTTVSLNGMDYEVEVLSVSSSEVLLSVNGETDTVDEFETEDIAGVSIAVTDLVSSSRDPVSGYAEIVVGGQKVTLLDDDGEVKVNDEDVSDLYPEYYVTSDIFANGFDTITITYAVEDDTLLEAGDSLVDPLFGGFELLFEGTNDPEYSEVELTSSEDSVSLDGELINGEDFNREFLYTTTTDGSTGVVYVRGDQDEDRIFFADSLDTISLIDHNTISAISGGLVTFDVDESEVRGSGLFINEDSEEQYLYEISSNNANDNEVDLDEELEGNDESELAPSEVLTDLEIDISGGSATSSDGDGTFTLDLGELGTAELGFVNELMMDFSSAEANITGSDVLSDSTLSFTYDEGDIDGDDTTVGGDEDEQVDVTLAWDSNDEELDLDISSSDFENPGNLADTHEDDDDVRMYVTSYGTIYEHDNDEETFLRIHVPDEQVRAHVSLVTGGSSAQTMTTTVSADAVDETRDELEAEGYTIVSTETLSSEEVEFDVDAPVLDSEVEEMENLIVVGGPAVNSVAAQMLGLSFPTTGSASGVNEGEAVIRHFEESNSVLVYGYSAEDTQAAADRLNEGGLSGESVNVE